MVVASLAAEGELDTTDVQIAVGTLAEARGEPREAASFDLYRAACTSAFVLGLPPLVAAELQLRVLIQVTARRADVPVRPHALPSGAAAR